MGASRIKIIGLSIGPLIYDHKSKQAIQFPAYKISDEFI